MTVAREDKPVIFKRAYNHAYEIYRGVDGNERSREYGNRVYVSRHERVVWLCKRLSEQGEVDSELFDLKREAVAWGNKWLDAAN